MINQKQQENKIMAEAIHKATQEVLDKPQFHSYSDNSPKQKRLHGIKRIMKFFKLLWIMSKEPNLQKKSSKQVLSPNETETKKSQETKATKNTKTSKLDEENKEIKEQLKAKIMKEKPRTLQQVIQKLKVLEQDVELTPTLTRKQIMTIYYKALYICQNREMLPEDINNNVLPPSNAFSRTRFSATSMLKSFFSANDMHKDTKQQERDKQLSKNAKTITPKYLKARLNYAIIDIKESVSYNIIILLGKRVTITSEDAKSIGLKPGSYKPITRISTDYSNLPESSTDDAKASLKQSAVRKGGNALTNMSDFVTDMSDEISSPSGKLSADVIKIKNKKLYKGDYGKDWQDSFKLLQDLMNNKA